MTEKETNLIARLKQKDTEALKEIICLYNRYVVTIVYEILHEYIDYEEIQSLTNHVFFLLWKSVEKIDCSKTENLKSYIGAIARNTAINERKKLRHTYPLNDDIYINGDASIEHAELKHILLNAIKKLSQEEQVILVKFYFQGKTTKKISLELHLPEATIKSKLRRSREKLKEFLMKGGNIYEN